MKKTIFINGKRILLDPAQLIQSGGEGMVFDLGQTAVKLYHHPTPQQQQKVSQLCTFAFPTGVLGPSQLAVNKQQKFVGFQMPKLPVQTLPFKRFANPTFWQQQAISSPTVVTLLQKVQQTLNQFHRAKMIVGDLNDTNLYFTTGSHASNSLFSCSPFWIDVDSYQFGSYPCPVAMDSFLDPDLYHIQNFSLQPAFTPQSDWYAFAVLLTKSLLQVHPYGGMHRLHKSLRSRAQAKISIFDSAVTLPKRTRPIESLSDELLHELHMIFDRGQRRPFPAQILNRYANNLTACSNCGLNYPKQRAGCPACKTQTPVPAAEKTVKQRLLLNIDGIIKHVSPCKNGRFWVVTRSGTQYRLIQVGIGGKLSDAPLFSGMPGYRFGVFDHYLAINPPQGPQLLILDIGQPQPKKVTLLETALFRQTAVFATTPRHLYRIAGPMVMQGSVQNGLYVEDAVATAHHRQTQLAASPYQDVIAGFHRIFAEHQFFIRDEKGAERPLTLPPLPTHEHIVETAFVFSPQHLGIILKIGHLQQFHTQVHTFSLAGEWKQVDQLEEEAWETAVATFPHHLQQQHSHIQQTLITPKGILTILIKELMWQSSK